MNKEQPDCSNHKKDLYGHDNMRQVAEDIGDLHYEVLSELLGRLAVKILKDSLKDKLKGRTELGYILEDTSTELEKAALHIEAAFKICKPYMK